VVATLGVLLAITGAAAAHYSAATLHLGGYLPQSTFKVVGVYVSWAQVIVVVSGIVVSAAMTLLLGRTRLGAAMRGVVDDPDLLEITGFDAAAVRRIAWMLGGGVAVLSGVLIAPTVGLNPQLLTYLVVQAFGAAAIGRFKNLPLTFVGGWVIGIVGAFGQKYANHYPALLGLPNAVPFMVLFVVLLASRRGTLPQATRARRFVADRFSPLPARWVAALAFALAALLVATPRIAGPKLPVFISAAGFAIVFLSLGLLVKAAGQVSLCHGALVAVGAASFSRFAVSYGLPWPLAVLCAGLIAVPVGAVVAIPAVRLSGIYLALATFAFGLLMENLFYRTFLLFGHQGALPATRPALGGIHLGTDTGYFYVAVCLAAVVALLMSRLQRARLGRVLGGLADSPLALDTFGANVTATLFVLFCISAFFAGVGGAVLASGTRAAGQADYGSFNSLLWIAVIAISGRRLISSSVIAALLLAVVPAYLPDKWIPYQPVVFGLVAVGVALAAANRYDLAARVKAALVGSERVGASSPVVVRGQRAGRSPVVARRVAS
jgi:ABC-type branched-subunit amino acid transport system permease subunit